MSACVVLFLFLETPYFIRNGSNLTRYLLNPNSSKIFIKRRYNELISNWVNFSSRHYGRISQYIGWRRFIDYFTGTYLYGLASGSSQWDKSNCFNCTEFFWLN